MKKSISLLPMLLLMIFSIEAQHNQRNILELDWGVAHLVRQDLSYSPLIHRTSSLMNTQLQYQRKGKLDHKVSARFGRFLKQTGDVYNYYNSDNTISEETYPHAFHFLDLNYSMSKSVLTKGNWEFGIGGRERNRLQVADYAFGTANFFSYYFTFGIDAMCTASYQLNEKTAIKSNLYLPLFSYQARSPYLGQNGAYFENASSHKPLPTVLEYIKDGQFVSWGKSQIVDFDLAFAYNISDKWDVGMKYLFSANFNQDPRELSSFENYIYLTTALKF